MSLAPAPERRTSPRRADPEQSSRPDLRVYTAEERLARTQRRQARLMLAISACVVAVALLIVGAANIVVTSRQFRVDALNSAVGSAVAENQNLQLQRAELESPARIVSIAEHRLGMVMPKSVTYLPAVPMPAAPVTKSHGARHTGTRAPAR